MRPEKETETEELFCPPVVDLEYNRLDLQKNEGHDQYGSGRWSVGGGGNYNNSSGGGVATTGPYNYNSLPRANNQFYGKNNQLARMNNWPSTSAVGYANNQGYYNNQQNYQSYNSHDYNSQGYNYSHCYNGQQNLGYKYQTAVLQAVERAGLQNNYKPRRAGATGGEASREDIQRKCVRV